MSDQQAAYQATIFTPIGKLGIQTIQDHLLALHYLKDDDPILKPKTWAAKKTIEQLLCYFADPTFTFDVPLAFEVTPFQEKVLKALQLIPVGTTQTYAELAQQLETKPRAIGNACFKNPIPVIIPCHRVVGSNGLGGYHGSKRGPFMEIKRWLLQHEQNKP